MHRLRARFHRLCGLFRRSALEAEMHEEMQGHLDGLTERKIAAGMSPEDARYAALREFGGVAQIAERARDERRSVWAEQLWQDLRYAVRSLSKSPSFTITAVLTLALGIGVNAALFAVYDFIVLRPLPSRQPEELVDIRGHNDEVKGRIDSRFSYLDFVDYSAETQAFSDIVAVTEVQVYWETDVPLEVRSRNESEPGVISMQAVSRNYFSALGATIAFGRDFLLEEAGAHAGQPVVVISHLFWQTHLHGDPDVLGTTLTTRDVRGGLDRTTYTIIGVTAPDFLGQSASTPAGWVPLTSHAAALGDRSRPLVSLTGRMKTGISSPQAKAELDAIARRLGQLYPYERRANSVQLTPGMRLVNLSLDPGLVLAMSPILLGFGLTLVMACLNVANLLLARGVTRQHEIGVRLVLGASRGRIVRQLFAENFLLCVLGAGAALVLALWTLQVLRPILLSVLANSDLLEASNYLSKIKSGFDARIIGFGALMMVIAGLTAGLGPAFQAVRRDGVFALKHEGSAFGRKLTPSRVRGLLLVAQVAVCLTLLTVSGLMTGKLLKTDMADSGVNADGVYQMRPSDASGAGSFLVNNPLEAVETLRTLPGVISAGLVSETPLRKPGDNFRSALVRVADRNPETVSSSLVSAGFFETFGVSMLSGRVFTPREVATGAAVVIVSETAAQRLWPGEEAVGKFLAVDPATVDRNAGQVAGAPNGIFRDYAVVGVARGIRNNWSRNDTKQLLWFPIPTKGIHGGIFVRLQTDSTASIRSVEQFAAAADVPVEAKERLATIVSRSLWPFRAFARISGALSVLVLIMATVGLYGMVSFGVNQRVREIGIRMALGATAERVTRLFVRQGLRLVAWGVAVGLVGGTAFAVLLNKVSPGADFAGDLAFRLIVFAAVTTFLSAVAMVACWLPARRATKVDPMVALRAE